MSTSQNIPRHKADRHEALFLRLASLTKQIEAGAVRRPLAPVPETLRLQAEGLLYESRQFRLHRSRGGLACVAPHYAALAAQLGTALAELVGFEERHTRRDGSTGHRMWLVEGVALPVRRLMPKPKPSAAADVKVSQAEAARKAWMLELREKLVLRIDQFKRRTPIEGDNTDPSANPSS